MYGTTEWVILNFLNFNQSLYFSTNTITNTLLNFILIFSFFIKVGLTPVHLYKLEIYKGLPYISIFFYTTFYFLVFFLFFLIFFLNYLGSFVLNYWYVYIISIVVGMFYTINLLFNVNLLKIFFAYSTMINSLGFICGGLSLLNC
jgi:NADH:ubiquinone oxidoreductase subunit 2 (subunit N)